MYTNNIRYFQISFGLYVDIQIMIYNSTIVYGKFHYSETHLTGFKSMLHPDI